MLRKPVFGFVNFEFTPSYIASGSTPRSLHRKLIVYLRQFLLFVFEIYVSFYLFMCNISLNNLVNEIVMCEINE